MVTFCRGDITTDVKNDLLRSNRIGCDTETSGLDWKVEKLHVCQIHSEAFGTVIIQFTRTVPRNLIEVLESSDVTKIFHHAPFDLAFLRSNWKLTARNVVCTKVASKLLHPERKTKHSLQELLLGVLDVRIDKGPVRISDWGAELSEEQLKYAADDVRFLIPLYERLSEGIVKAGLSDLYDTCCNFLPARSELDQFFEGDIFAY